MTWPPLSTPWPTRWPSSEKRRQEFVANISHELKTPMTTIAGFADGILDGTIPPEKAKRLLSRSSLPRPARLSPAWCGVCWTCPALQSDP